MSHYIPDDGPDTGTTARTYEDRADAVKANWPVCDSVVDLGAYNGRLAREVAARFNITGAAIDDFEGLRGDDRIETFGRATAKELGSIIRDSGGRTTVVALSVLHHLLDWKKYVGVIERNASYAFIETAHPDEALPEAVAHDQSAAILSWVEKKGGTVIHESPGWDSQFNRQLWLLDFTKG